MDMQIAFSAYWSLLATYLRPQRGRVTLLAALLAGGIAAQLANPLIVAFFIDAAMADRSTSTLTTAAVLFIAVALIGQGIGIAETWAAEQVAWTATNILRHDLARHCLRLDPAFYQAHAPGELIERVDGDVTVLANFFSRFMIAVVANVLLLVGILAVLFVMDWRIGLPLMGFALVVLFAFRRLGTTAAPRWAAFRQAFAELFGFMEERLAAADDLRANGAVPHTLRRLDPLMGRLMHRLRGAAVISGASWGTTVVLFSVGTAIAFGLGAVFFRAGAITLGTVYLIFIYTEQLRRPIEQISRQIQDLQQASASISRVQELFATRPAITDDLDAAPAPSGALGVAFEQVSFAYPGGEPVLHDISFRLSPGVTLGIVGRTGSGKTTLARLLLRFYDPMAGTIQLGDTALRSLSLPGVRRRIGFVTQDVQLFAASVRDNITFFDRAIPDERILAIMAELGLEPWLGTLPAGLDTHVHGNDMSAGQAQLLALCRVFIKDPSLLILDEATARIDPATDRLIQGAIGRLLAGRTGIIIAHRLATLDRVDQIMVIEDGRIQEYGDREALERDPASRFSQLRKSGVVEGGP